MDFTAHRPARDLARHAEPHHVPTLDASVPDALGMFAASLVPPSPSPPVCDPIRTRPSDPVRQRSTGPQAVSSVPAPWQTAASPWDRSCPAAGSPPTSPHAAPVITSQTGPRPSPLAAGVHRVRPDDRLAHEALSPLASSNTPAIPTLPLIVDWLRCTFPATLDALERAMMQFGPGLEWVQMDRGGFFFERCIRRGHVSIYYDGKVETNQGLVLVEVSGRGCRQLESEGVLDVPCAENAFLGGWRGFLGDLQELGCAFPRVDWALDDTSGLLDLDKIAESWRAGNCASRFRDMDERRKHRRDGDLVGHTLNFGSRTSQMFVRIYNKRLEQIVRGEEVPHAQWVRVELEAKGKGAAALVARFVTEGAVPVAQALWYYLDFKEPGGDTNVCRRNTCSWWLAFVEWAKDKVPVGIGTATRTLEGMAKALRRQWSAGIALLLEAESHGADWLAELLEHGRLGLWDKVTGAMKSKYKTLLAAGVAPVQPVHVVPDGPVVFPAHWAPLGTVQSAVWEPEPHDDWYFSPFLADATDNGFYKCTGEVS